MSAAAGVVERACCAGRDSARMTHLPTTTVQQQVGDSFANTYPSRLILEAQDNMINDCGLL